MLREIRLACRNCLNGTGGDCLEKKNSFVMYTDYQDHIDLLDMEQRGMLLTAIMEYASSGTVTEIDGMVLMAFSFIRKQMDRDNEKYQNTVEKRREAGKLGGRPPKAKGFEEKAKKAKGFSEKQTKAKKPDTDNVNDNDTDNDIKKESIEKSSRFSPPTRQEVEEYCKEKGYTVDAERFVDFYESKGWMVGKNKMKDWRAAVRNWNRSQRQESTTKGKNKFNDFPQRGYDMDSLEAQLLGGKKEEKE